MRRKTILRVLFAAFGGAMILLAGCGGGSGGMSPAASSGGMVTRASEGKYSTDALILAAREASGPRIPAADATAVDADLSAIRAQVPGLQAVHARPLDDLKSLLVYVAPDAPFLTAWKQGTVKTGQSALDSLLAQYKATSVQSLTALNSAQAFVVRFDDPLNTKALIAPLTAASPSVVGANGNGAIGDGNQITRTTADGGKRVYAFSVGWDDCPAGCISRHIWTVTIAAGGGISVAESGNPLPAGSGNGA